ncbi:hypothetical protein FRACYDRAFT_231860 [Fragilariopsis cylindrus CCMP1102]|uniref:Uncharacterized protein n=1 Tax=Fragilariopsis cylindrus CCMP1102 TaxID=635003 RepID=A0A1E7FU84_9STRA|nr:hypothetical protein FRACYDRAFT_231860 [Fragilariopsis cylindrus CCMP1102]|eukprot:OEU21716.1 hypothetical protein FRACYDRAFT_231860 [Fragilariopsis cylindrus CCMP1102]
MMELINPPEAFTIGAYGRSQLLREIVAGISEKDRGWLITLCTNCIPTEIDFIDGIIVKSGCINMMNTVELLNCLLVVYCVAMTVDNNCNIEPYELPPIIGHFERLNYLGVIGDCRSLPMKELCMHESLEKLSQFLRTLDPVFKIKLKRLDMVKCKIDENRLKILMFEIVPKFEDLAVLSFYNNEIERNPF